jgi:hypothetical protein
MVLEMPGFAFDQPGAEALARALRSTIEAALAAGVSTPTVLAALALDAASVVARSGLRTTPGLAARAVGELMQMALAAERLPW